MMYLWVVEVFIVFFFSVMKWWVWGCENHVTDIFVVRDTSRVRTIDVAFGCRKILLFCKSAFIALIE